MFNGSIIDTVDTLTEFCEKLTKIIKRQAHELEQLGAMQTEEDREITRLWENAEGTI